MDGDDIYWLEGRPTEGGRNALVRRAADGTIADVTPREFNVRTRVHEYGGGAYAVADGVVYFFELHRSARLSRSGSWTDAGRSRSRRRRRGSTRTSPSIGARQQLICVREDHSGGGEPVNTLVRVPLDRRSRRGRGDRLGLRLLLDAASQSRRLAAGVDRWRHPQMPWDGTELWVADVTPEGTLANARHVAGGDSESIYQPGWSPDGTLYFVSDRDGWWKLYRVSAAVAVASTRSCAIRRPSAEFGRPQWVFGTATWAFADADRIVAAYTRAGRWHLATVHVHTGLLTDVPHGPRSRRTGWRPTRAARGRSSPDRPIGPTPWCAST